MQLRTLFACASFVAAAVAQISQDRIAFTVLPTNVQAGKPVTLQWGGGNGAPVTITLQQGQTTNLKTVEVLTGDATGNSYTWTPSSSLPNAEDYALKIEQGTQPPNYTGMITLTGGSGSGSSSSASVSVSGSTSAYVPSTASSAAPTSGSSSPTGGVIGGSQNSTSTSTPIVNTNSTSPTTAAPIRTGAVGTGAGASGSAATGTALHRNTTLSKATLTTSSSATTSSAAATTTSGGSETSGGPAPSSSSQSGGVVAAASNFALLCAAVVGVVYLG